MARIFVTGGTRYVGRRLVRALLQLGHEVRVLTPSAARQGGRFPACGSPLDSRVGEGGAWPAPVTQAYLAVRAQGEAALAASGPDVVMPLEKKWHGPTEFACTDPDGYVITFAEQEQ